MYVPEDVVSSKDMAELITKLILNLRKGLLMGAMAVPKLPYKDEQEYLYQIQGFLQSKYRKKWSRLQIAHVNPKNLALDHV